MFLQKWRVKLGHAFALAILLCAKPELEWLVAGSVVAAAGEGLRVYASGIIAKDETLSRAGPYAYTRNPLYFGSFLMSLGLCVASGNVWVIAAFPLFFFPVYYATILREEDFLRGKFGDRFDEFRKSVPRFVPRPWPARGAGKADFAWTQVKHNKEYEGFCAAAVILMILWAMWLGGWNVPRALGM